MRYRVRCKLARTRGAIGMFYSIAVVIDAESASDAVRQYQDRYETNGPPVEWFPLEAVSPEVSTDE